MSKQKQPSLSLTIATLLMGICGIICLEVYRHDPTNIEAGILSCLFLVVLLGLSFAVILELNISKK